MNTCELVEPYEVEKLEETLLMAEQAVQPAQEGVPSLSGFAAPSLSGFAAPSLSGFAAP